jgi:hypothetical protein
MPGLDKTGPLGQGSQTGRKMGRCNQENETNVDEMPRGRGLGRGLGRKMRLKNGWNAPGSGEIFGRGKGRGRR